MKLYEQRRLETDMMPAFTILLDADAFDAHDDASLLDAFTAYAITCGMDVHAPRVVGNDDTHRFGNDVLVRFCAPREGVRDYIEANDLDTDAITDRGFDRVSPFDRDRNL